MALLRPTGRKNKVDLIFPFLAWASVVISLAISLTVYQIIVTFNVGMENALRGLFPEVLIYKGEGRPQQLYDSEISKIIGIIEDISPGTPYATETFHLNVNLVVKSEPEKHSLDTPIRTAFKIVTPAHLKTTSTKQLIPLPILEKIIQQNSSQNSVAMSTDLFTALKSSNAIVLDSPGNNPYFYSHSGKTVRISHIFKVLEGSISRLCIGNQQSYNELLDPLEEPDDLPNLIGVDYLDKDKRNFISNTLNLSPKVPEPDAIFIDEEHSKYSVKIWKELLPYKVSQLITVIKFIPALVFTLLCFPAMIHIILALSTFIRNKVLEINLLRVFGKARQYLGTLLFAYGILLGFITGAMGLAVCWVITEASRNDIEIFLSNLTGVDILLTPLPADMVITYMMLLTLFFGLIVLITSRNLLQKTASQLIEH